MSQNIKRIPILCLSLILPILIFILMFTFFQPSQAADPEIYYVAKTGDGGDGLSWTTAYTDLQDALGVAVSGDEIWVASGVYTPGLSQSDSFDLVDGVSIYGGFATMTETMRSQRDWKTNVTVLSGDIDGDDYNDFNGVVTDTTNIIGTNSYHVISSTGVVSTTILDGFIVTSGQSNGTIPSDFGGGMFNNNSNPTLSNLIFSGNYANSGGGGIFNLAYSNPFMTHITFTHNTAGTYGGGILNWNSSNPYLMNVMFNNNWADYGGGICNYGNSQPSLINIRIIGNSSWVDGGGIYNLSSSPVIISGIFSDNWAELKGGGLTNIDGSNPIISNVEFQGNFADEGGGMANLESSNPILTNVTFSGNDAGSGGGMYNASNSSPVIKNARFSGNHAGDNGGGLYNDNSNPNLLNVTISYNFAETVGGGLFNFESNFTVKNSIFWNNQDADNLGDLSSNIYNWNSSSSIVFSNTLLQGSGGSSSWIGGNYIDGGNNIDENPLFITPINPSTAPTTTGNLRLSIGSPAIDAGNNSYVAGIPTDLDDKPRIINGIVDLGAYETWIYVFLPLILR